MLGMQKVVLKIMRFILLPSDIDLFHGLMRAHGCRTNHPLRKWHLELSVTAACMSPSGSWGAGESM